MDEKETQLTELLQKLKDQAKFTTSLTDFLSTQSESFSQALSLALGKKLEPQGESVEDQLSTLIRRASVPRNIRRGIRDIAEAFDSFILSVGEELNRVSSSSKIDPQTKNILQQKMAQFYEQILDPTSLKEIINRSKEDLVQTLKISLRSAEEVLTKGEALDLLLPPERASRLTYFAREVKDKDLESYFLLRQDYITPREVRKYLSTETLSQALNIAISEFSSIFRETSEAYRRLPVFGPLSFFNLGEPTRSLRNEATRELLTSLSLQRSNLQERLNELNEILSSPQNLKDEQIADLKEERAEIIKTLYETINKEIQIRRQINEALLETFNTLKQTSLKLTDTLLSTTRNPFVDLLVPALRTAFTVGSAVAGGTTDFLSRLLPSTQILTSQGRRNIPTPIPTPTSTPTIPPSQPTQPQNTKTQRPITPRQIRNILAPQGNENIFTRPPLAPQNQRPQNININPNNTGLENRFLPGGNRFGFLLPSLGVGLLNEFLFGGGIQKEDLGRIGLSSALGALGGFLGSLIPIPGLNLVGSFLLGTGGSYLGSYLGNFLFGAEKEPTQNTLNLFNKSLLSSSQNLQNFANTTNIASLSITSLLPNLKNLFSPDLFARGTGLLAGIGAGAIAGFADFFLSTLNKSYDIFYSRFVQTRLIPQEIRNNLGGNVASVAGAFLPGGRFSIIGQGFTAEEILGTAGRLNALLPLRNNAENLANALSRAAESANLFGTSIADTASFVAQSTKNLISFNFAKQLAFVSTGEYSAFSKAFAEAIIQASNSLAIRQAINPQLFATSMANLQMIFRMSSNQNIRAFAEANPELLQNVFLSFNDFIRSALTNPVASGIAIRAGLTPRQILQGATPENFSRIVEAIIVQSGLMTQFVGGKFTPQAREYILPFVQQVLGLTNIAPDAFEELLTMFLTGKDELAKKKVTELLYRAAPEGRAPDREFARQLDTLNASFQVLTEVMQKNISAITNLNQAIFGLSTAILALGIDQGGAVVSFLSDELLKLISPFAPEDIKKKLEDINRLFGQKTTILDRQTSSVVALPSNVVITPEANQTTKQIQTATSTARSAQQERKAQSEVVAEAKLSSPVEVKQVGAPFPSDTYVLVVEGRPVVVNIREFVEMIKKNK